MSAVVTVYQNFLFTTRDEDAPLKIIDFGLSDFVKPGNNHLSSVLYFLTFILCFRKKSFVLIFLISLFSPTLNVFCFLKNKFGKHLDDQIYREPISISHLGRWLACIICVITSSGWLSSIESIIGNPFYFPQVYCFPKRLCSYN